MAVRTDTYDLGPLRLRAGEAKTLELEAVLEPFELSNQTYAVVPSPIPVRVDASRMNHGGWALRLRFEAGLRGPCMRCLDPAAPSYAVDVREVDQPGEGPELDSPYVDAEVLDVGAWTRDSLALELPAQVLCRPDCRGLCPECGIDLNTAPADHAHEKGPDPRWAALREISFEEPPAS
jgi:uncharacterized protein